ncbi:YihY family inner membrane protein [Thalassospiraceae bacterium LMO-SO8]|nr:YihY family inner membrane protein [Alphaproteobacteria bacterium LMO-S08]WND76005.1 YihY family inner membrane protein [Thalassospiraceae bacterium LMO-SO8]
MRRFQGDQCLRMAASLSYTSLLAAVPLTAIAFAMLAAFPVFEGVRESFQDVLFANFLPDAAESMREHFDKFVRNTTTLSAVGIIALALTAVLLLGTIESALNTIFRVTRPRRLGPRLLVFWAIITLGPLLLGASFSLSAYFFAATQWIGVDPATGVLGEAAKLLPTLIMMVLLTMFYVTIPNRPVAFAGAVIGAVAAGLMIAVLRKGFGFYVTHFPTYQNIYGALSAVPIFLIWMYLSWAVVLLGATLTATISEWREAGGRPVHLSSSPSSRLTAAVSVLACLFARSREGGGASRRELVRAARVSLSVLEPLLETLRGEGYVERTSRNAWVLCRDLHTVTLYDLYRDLGLGISDIDETLKGGGWQAALAAQLGGLRARNAEAMAMPVAEILEASEDGGAGKEAASLKSVS